MAEGTICYTGDITNPHRTKVRLSVSLKDSRMHLGFLTATQKGQRQQHHVLCLRSQCCSWCLLHAVHSSLPWLHGSACAGCLAHWHCSPIMLDPDVLFDQHHIFVPSRCDAPRSMWAWSIQAAAHPNLECCRARVHGVSLLVLQHE